MLQFLAIIGAFALALIVAVGAVKLVERWRDARNRGRGK